MRSDWGSVKQVRKGVWRIRYWADSECGYKRQSKTIRGTRTDANDALAALRLDHSKDAPTPTMNDCWKRWLLPYYEKRLENGDLSKRSFKQYLNFWSSHIKPRWGTYQVDSIRPIAVQEWIDTKTQSTASPLIGMCKKAVNFACTYELCNKNIFDIKYIMPSKTTVCHRENTIWTLKQLLSTLEVIHEKYTWLLPSYILCAFGSCRVGESWAVKKTDIELIKVDNIKFAKVSINKQCLEDTTVSKKLKTPQSNRTVIIPDELATYITNIDREWLMSNEYTGELIPRRVLCLASEYSIWRNVLNTLNYPYAPYARLRASWRTFMQDEFGMHSDMLEKMMGHKGQGVTNAHYYKPQEDVYTKAYIEAYKKMSICYRLRTIWDAKIIFKQSTCMFII